MVSKLSTNCPKEFFNMKHAAVRNVIEICFGLLKMRWGILRSPSFYPIRVHNRIIVACCLLHNFIRKEMSVDPFEYEISEYLHSNPLVQNDPIIGIEPSDLWTNWRLKLVNQMFTEL